MDPETVERWLRHQDNRTDTAYDYGEDFAEATQTLLPTLIVDAKALANILEAVYDDCPVASVVKTPPDAGSAAAVASARRRSLCLSQACKSWSHDGSDLDRVLRGPDLTGTRYDELRNFEEAIPESDIPLQVEARDWAGLAGPVSARD